MTPEDELEALRVSRFRRGMIVGMIAMAIMVAGLMYADYRSANYGQSIDTPAITSPTPPADEVQITSVWIEGQGGQRGMVLQPDGTYAHAGYSTSMEVPQMPEECYHQVTAEEETTAIASGRSPYADCMPPGSLRDASGFEHQFDLWTTGKFASGGA